jgi:putative ABC transport system substrate-binding protein
MSQIHRRQFLIATSALLAASFARAQPARRFRVGWLWSSSEVAVRPYRDAFVAGMRERGYLVERNLTLDQRYGEGNPGRFEALAEELIALKPDVLAGIEGPAVALRSKTTTIPIVLIASSNPVASGLVQSLARPGTNVTGLSFRLGELIAKQFELLVEISPKIARVAFFNQAVRPGDPGESTAALFEQSARKAANDKGLTLVIVAANDVAGARNAFERLQSERVQGLVVAASGPTHNIRDEIIAGARRLRLPSISGLSASFAERGGLATYGPNFLESYRYAASYVDRILKGAKPAELPVEQMATFELVINLKTAKEIGLTIPKAVLFRADRVIE